MCLVFLYDFVLFQGKCWLRRTVIHVEREYKAQYPWPNSVEANTASKGKQHEADRCQIYTLLGDPEQTAIPTQCAQGHFTKEKETVHRQGHKEKHEDRTPTCN